MQNSIKLKNESEGFGGNETVGLPNNIIPLTTMDNAFQKIKILIEEKTGNYFNASREGIVNRIIEQRVQEQKFKSMDEYLTFLNIIPVYHQEWRVLTSKITNNESYFFRESHHFITLEQELIPQLLTFRPNKTVKILSAACSEGQEAYTLSMVMKEAKMRFSTLDYQIYGIDIDEQALTKARAGRYTQYSFREPKFKSYIDRYFLPSGEDLQIKDEIKQSVNFVQGNLINGNQLAMLPQFDVIFCRNVLIYFRDHHFKSALTNLFNLLQPGGYLFLGHSESALSVIPNLVPVSFSSFIGYKKLELS